MCESSSRRVVETQDLGLVMGCGASSESGSASGGAGRAPPPGVDGGSVADESSTLAAVSTAAVVVEIGCAAGSCLLELGKAIPFVAPVAYAIGAVVGLAETAVALKEDAAAFAQVCVHVETALLKASNLEGQRDVVEGIGRVLDDAATFMGQLQERNWLSKLVWADHDARKFSSMRDELMVHMQTLSLSVQLDLAEAQAAEFAQSVALGDLINESGGLDKLQADPNAMDAAMERMSATDRVHLAVARDTNRKIDESVADGRETLKLVRTLSVSAERQQAEAMRMEMQNALIQQQMEHMRMVMQHQQMVMSQFLAQSPLGSSPSAADRMLMLKRRKLGELFALENPSRAIFLEDRIDDHVGMQFAALAEQIVARVAPDPYEASAPGAAGGDAQGRPRFANLCFALLNGQHSMVHFMFIWYCTTDKKWKNNFTSPMGDGAYYDAPQKGAPCHYVAALDQVVCTRKAMQLPTGIGQAMQADMIMCDPKSQTKGAKFGSAAQGVAPPGCTSEFVNFVGSLMAQVQDPNFTYVGFPVRVDNVAVATICCGVFEEDDEYLHSSVFGIGAEFSSKLTALMESLTQDAVAASSVAWTPPPPSPWGAPPGGDFGGAGAVYSRMPPQLAGAPGLAAGNFGPPQAMHGFPAFQVTMDAPIAAY